MRLNTYTYTPLSTKFLIAASSLALGALFGSVATLTGLSAYNGPVTSLIIPQRTYKEAPDCRCQYTDSQRRKLNKLTSVMQNAVIIP